MYLACRLWLVLCLGVLSNCGTASPPRSELTVGSSITQECESESTCGDGGICLLYELKPKAKRYCTQRSEICRDVECSNGGECLLFASLPGSVVCASRL